jgi:outer membrane protein TolC
MTRGVPTGAGVRAAAAVFILGLLAVPAQTQDSPIVTVGVLIDGESERIMTLLDLLRTEIDALTKNEFELRVPEEKIVIADWTRVGVEIGMGRLLGDREVDLVLAIGAISADVAAGRGVIPKPLITPLAIDADVQGFPFDPATGGSGVPNFTYANILAPTNRDIRTFLEIHPFSKLAVIVQPALAEAMPTLPESVLAQLEELSVEVKLVPARATPEETVAAIPKEAEAVYVLPLMRFNEDDIEILAEELKNRGLPSFSMFGVLEVERGLLAGLRTRDFWPRLARRMALNVQRVLLGEDPGDIPVSFAENPRLVINMRTARSVGVFPTWLAMSGADLLHEEETEGSETMRLTDAVDMAESANLDLVAFDRQVAAGLQFVEEAKGRVRPQVLASASGVVIDEDRAASSFGSRAERSFAASLGLDQIIYSEPVFANITIQKRLQDNLEVQREILRLDVVQEAATAFLIVLRAQGLYEIQKENLRVSRRNLELAQIRQRIGTAGISEVYRWQSAIATSEQATVISRENLNVAKVNLNRVLNRSQNTKFVPENVNHLSPIFMSGDLRTWRYIYSPRGYEIFIEFMVELGLRNSVELEALDAAIAAARRAASAARRQLYIPDFFLSAEIRRYLSRSGAGSGEIEIPLPIEFPRVDDTDWSVGLFGALPLYAGGSNRAVQRRTREELFQLQVEREAVSDRVEQRIRSALLLGGASFYSIELAQAAADAALRSLDLVTESYVSGAVTIVELLDAQAAALRASENASNAVYDFLIDFMEVERSISMFSFFQTEAERDDFYRQVHEYLTARGVQPLPEDQVTRSLRR